MSESTKSAYQVWFGRTFHYTEERFHESDLEAAWRAGAAQSRPDSSVVAKLRDRLTWVIKHLEGGCDQEAAILEAKDGLAESAQHDNQVGGDDA